jgi:hypothetical protein
VCIALAGYLAYVGVKKGLITQRWVARGPLCGVQMLFALQDQLNNGEQGEEGAPDFDISIENQEGSPGGDGEGDEDDKSMEEELRKAAEQLAEDLADKFEEV